jgi:hypothetical protein
MLHICMLHRGLQSKDGVGISRSDRFIEGASELARWHDDELGQQAGHAPSCAKRPFGQPGTDHRDVAVSVRRGSGRFLAKRLLRPLRWRLAFRRLRLACR